MDPLFLEKYNEELQHVREMGAEFAKRFPKIAGRLGIEGFECIDPYVERLLEGFAFMAARIQLRLDAEFPRFTRNLLEMVFPQYLAPVPSMAVVRLEPDPSEGDVAEGFVVPRHTTMRSVPGKGQRTACLYRTSQDVQLWPIEIAEVEYFTHTRDLADINLSRLPPVKAGIRLRLRTVGGMNFDKLPLDRLTFFLRGTGELAMHLYRQILADSIAVVARPIADGSEPIVIDEHPVGRVGFDDEEALLPYGPRSFQGYRLLREYFAFPERFRFVELGNLGDAVRRCGAEELDLTILLKRREGSLQDAIQSSNFALFCTPAINLFPRTTDWIHLDKGRPEHHVVPDRTRPLDFEVFSVSEATARGTSADEKRVFRPFYSSRDRHYEGEGAAYFVIDRRQRVLSQKEEREGARSSYTGSEVFLSLVDAEEAPYDTELKQLALTTMCTNRDLPLHMAVGAGKTDFTLESGAPVNTVRCLEGPSPPIPSNAQGETAWRLIGHLSLNYLSLVNRENQGATGLRELLELYGDLGDSASRKQIDGVHSVESKSVVRRLPVEGPAAFGRGLEIGLTMDPAQFEGSGVFLLGSVLEDFFSRYVSINSFTQTVLRTTDGAEVARWPVRSGRRHQL